MTVPPLPPSDPQELLERERPTPLRVRVALGLVVLGVVALGGLIGVRVKEATAKRDAVARERAQTQEAASRKPPLELARPTPMRWRPRVDLTGTLRPWREADLGFELGGRLVDVAVATGDRVKAGQVLAVLDASRAGAEVNAADAQARAAAASLALAEDNLRRTEALVQTKSIPDAQAEQARQQVALARAQLDGAQASARLAKTGVGLHSVVAPFSGIVTKAPTSAGGVVQPGAPLVHLEDCDRLRLSATVSEDDAPLVSAGEAVTVVYRDRSVAGKVVALVPSLDQATRRAPIEVEVQNGAGAPGAGPPLLAWSFVRAHLDGKGELDALRLPPAARRAGSQDEVVTYVAGKAHIVHVAHVVDDDGSWIVTKGLRADELVVLGPDPETKEGDPVDATMPGGRARGEATSPPPPSGEAEVAREPTKPAPPKN